MVRVAVVVVVGLATTLVLPLLVLSLVLGDPLPEELQLLPLQPRQLASPPLLILPLQLPVFPELLHFAVTPVVDTLHIGLEREPLVLEEGTNLVGTALNRLTGAVKLGPDAVTQGRCVELVVAIAITIAVMMMMAMVMFFTTTGVGRGRWVGWGWVGRRRGVSRGRWGRWSSVIRAASGRYGSESEKDEETHGERGGWVRVDDLYLPEIVGWLVFCLCVGGKGGLGKFA